MWEGRSFLLLKFGQNQQNSDNFVKKADQNAQYHHETSQILEIIL